MLATIIADASHCGQTLVAGYGYWAVSGRGRHAGAGVFKEKLRDSTVAETMAVVNALFCAVRLGIVQEGDSVIIQTDSVAAIHCLDNRDKGRGKIRLRQDMVTPANAFGSLRDSKKLEIEFRHIKGHSGVRDNRSRAQRQADIRARRAMRQARKAILVSIGPPKPKP